jgi:hypothetical protein
VLSRAGSGPGYENPAQEGPAISRRSQALKAVGLARHARWQLIRPMIRVAESQCGAIIRMVNTIIRAPCVGIGLLDQDVCRSVLLEAVLYMSVLR